MNNVSSLPLLLKQLKLMTMLKLWEDHEQEAKNNNLSHAKYLQLLVELEVNSRYSSKVKRHMRESKLPSGKSIATFNFTDIPSINKSQIDAFTENTKWVNECHNILLFGASGLGKNSPSMRYSLWRNNARNQGIIHKNYSSCSKVTRSKERILFA